MEKLNIEIQRVNKNSKKIEWTETIELPYENKKESEVKVQLDQSDSLVNTRAIELGKNPFYQPTMNTFEFENETEDELLIVNLTKETSTYNNEININDKLLALDKLYEDKIISKREYNKKKNKILLLGE